MYNTRLRRRIREEAATKTVLQSDVKETAPKQKLKPLGDHNRSIEVFREINTNMRQDTPMPKTIRKQKISVNVSSNPEAAPKKEIQIKKRVKRFLLPSVVPVLKNADFGPAILPLETPNHHIPTSSPINALDYKNFEISAEISAIDVLCNYDGATAVLPALNESSEKDVALTTPAQPITNLTEQTGKLESKNSSQHLPTPLATCIQPSTPQKHKFMMTETFNRNVKDSPDQLSPCDNFLAPHNFPYSTQPSDQLHACDNFLTPKNGNPKDMKPRKLKLSSSDDDYQGKLGEKSVPRGKRSNLRKSTDNSKEKVDLPKPTAAVDKSFPLKVANAHVPSKLGPIFEDSQNTRPKDALANTRHRNHVMPILIGQGDEPKRVISKSGIAVSENPGNFKCGESTYAMPTRTSKLNPSDYPICPIVLAKCTSKRPNRIIIRRKIISATVAAGEDGNHP